MFSQPFVHKRVVRSKQIHDAAILVDNALEEQLRLTTEGLAQIVVEVRKNHGDGLLTLQTAQVQPLTSEVIDQRVRPWIDQHPANLRLQHRRVAQLALARQIDQLIVRYAAPEEKREPRSQFDVADTVSLARRQIRRQVFLAEQKFRIRQQPLNRDLNADPIRTVRSAGYSLDVAA